VPAAPTTQDRIPSAHETLLERTAPDGLRVVRTGRLGSLDLLRFAAALAVVGYHFTAWRSAGGSAWSADPSVRPADLFPVVSEMTRYGFLGVDVFFLVSGFVICMSVWNRTTGEFFASRVARLYPAFWASVLLTTTVCTLWPHVREGLSPREVLVNLTMLHEPLGVHPVDGVYWTLFVELRFYLVLAVLALAGLTYRRVLGLCIGWTLASVFGTALADGSPALRPAVDLLVMPQWSPYFISGMALYLVYRNGSNPIVWGVVAVSWVLAVDDRLSHLGGPFGYVQVPLSHTVVITVLTAAFVTVAVIALGLTDRFHVEWFTTLGALTYPLYLLHQNIGWTMIYALRDPLGRWLAAAVATAAVIGLAWLVHRWVERPLGPRLRRAMVNALPR
jgi:peptidoglycan/LPS O-acetylase OafA/YrhL